MIYGEVFSIYSLTNFKNKNKNCQLDNNSYKKLTFLFF